MIPNPIPGDEARQEAGLQPRAASAGERWRHAFGLASAWWTSPEWPLAWTLLLALLGIELGNVYIFVLFNGWQQSFFDALQNRQAGAFAGLLFGFFGIAGGQVATILSSIYMKRTLGLRWRTFLTVRYLDRWLARNRYHEIERLRLIDNPDQRIADDVNSVTANLPGIVIGYVTAAVGAASFIVILLRTSQWIRFDVLGMRLAIPGDMVVYGFLYVIVGSVGMVLIGRPYVRRTQRQQHLEADFRAALIHIRRNAAQIGFARNVAAERHGLIATFEGVRHNYKRVILAYLGLSAGQSIYERLGGFLPLFLTVPRFFAGRMTFGQMMGARDAFQMLVGNLSFFIQTYASLAAQIANLNRLKGLDDAIDHHRPHGIAVAHDPAPGIALATRNLRMSRPAGEPLAEIGDWTVRRGERWVVWGASGAGKSTLLRAVAGLWPDGAGSVAMMGDGLAMFVPQRLYLPQGTLKDAIVFPDLAVDHADDTIVALLDLVGLEAHRESLHALRYWQEDLSPGEQQRVALARILLHRPDLLILDEGTSALDSENARAFYLRILDAMPDLTMVSVIHDDRLAAFHTHRLSIEDGRATTETLER